MTSKSSKQALNPASERIIAERLQNFIVGYEDVEPEEIVTDESQNSTEEVRKTGCLYWLVKQIVLHTAGPIFALLLDLGETFWHFWKRRTTMNTTDPPDPPMTQEVENPFMGRSTVQGMAPGNGKPKKIGLCVFATIAAVVVWYIGFLIEANFRLTNATLLLTLIVVFVGFTLHVLNQDAHK